VKNEVNALDRLKELREKKGISLLALSKIISVSDGQLGKYEKGLSEPRPDVRQELADYFGVSVAYLMGHEVVKEDLDLEDVKMALYRTIEKYRGMEDSPEKRKVLLPLLSLEQYLNAMAMIELSDSIDDEGNYIDAYFFSYYMDEFSAYMQATSREEREAGEEPSKNIEKMKKLISEHHKNTKKKWSK